MAKVTVDGSTCIGCGLCEQMCPDVFTVKDGVAAVKADKCSSCDVSEVASQCPVNAIQVS